MEREVGNPLAWDAVIADLSAEQCWNLDKAERQRYEQALRAYLPPGASAADVRRTCISYHEDHQLVAALLDDTHPRNIQMWREWTQKAIQILYKAGFAQIGDQAVAVEDLAQAALTEIARSLHRFRFQSRLATWAHTVIVKTACRILRDSRAQKRPQQCTSFEQLPAFEEPIPEGDQPEAVADAEALCQLVRATLTTMGGERLTRIFFLHAVNGRSTEEIGKLVHLHPSRVRALLAQARRILRNHPDLQTWAAD